MKQKLLKSFRLRVGMLVAILCSAFAGTAWADSSSVTYTVTSKTEVSSSGTAPTGSSVSYSQTYGTACQATSGNDFTLTLSNWGGYTISNITFSMKSNKSAGAGTLSYSTDGGTTEEFIIGSKSGTAYGGVGFNDQKWYGSYSQEYVDVSKAVEIEAGSSNVVIHIHATVNSLYCQSYTITYAPTSSSAVATTTTIDATGITNTDVYGGTAAGSLAATVSAGETTVSGATVTWSGDNDGVATIDEETGAVTLVAAGTVTFTASYAGDDDYKASSDTYEMTVTDTTPFSGGDVTFVCGTDVSETTSITKDGVTMTMTSGVWNRTDNYRLYANNSLTISTESGTITSIVFTISQNNFIGTGYDATTNTWTGNASSVTLAANGGQVRFTPVIVTVDLNGTPDPVVINTYETIPDLFEAATAAATDVKVTFDSWVVSGVSTNGKNVFVTDNAGNGFVIFDNDGGLGDTYAVGDILSGTEVPCELVLYHGFAEITGLDASNLTITAGGAVSVADVALADLAGVNTGALVSYDGLTYNGTNLSDGTTTVQVYNTLFAFDALEDGKTYNITGIYQQYNNTKEILPRSAADIVEVVAPAITVTPATVSLTASEEEGTLDITYENLTIDDMTDFDVQFYDAEGTEIEGPDWIEVLVAEQDPSVGEGYVVSYYMIENEGEARTAYFKVFALGDADYVYSNLVTVTQAEYVAPEAGATVTFDFSTNDFEFPEGSSNKKVDAEDYTDGTYTFNVAGSTGNGYYWNTDGYLLMGKNGATLTFPAFTFNVSKIKITGKSGASGSVIQNIYVDDEAVSTATTGAQGTNEYVIADDYQAAGTIYTLKVTSSHNTQISKIEVFGYESVTVSSAGYATFASDNALDFTNSSIKAFYATVEGSTLTFHQVTKVPANTGVLLYAANGATEDVPVLTGDADAVTSNVFVRGTGAAVSYSETEQNYILFNGTNGIGFYKASNNRVATNRAYIQVPASVSGVKFFGIDLEDDATGIEHSTLNIDHSNDVIYDLSGRKINGQSSIVNGQLRKGIYIVNGKKILK